MNLVKLDVPHVRQRQTSDCVAACAAMVLDYMKYSVSYEHVSRVIGVNWFGTPSSFVRKLEKLGITVIYKQGSFEELYEHLLQDRPCITFVKTLDLPYWSEQTDHAVVVMGLDDHHIYVNDPAFPDAPKEITRGDFDLAWLELDEMYAVLKRK